MKKFEKLVAARKGNILSFLNYLRFKTICSVYFVDELSGEIFDLLISLGDFLEFKDNMVSYKNAKGSPNSFNLDLSVSGKHF